MIVAVVIVAAGCSSDSNESDAGAHSPVRTSELKVLPPPPAPFATRDGQSGWDFLSGSRDRLVMARLEHNRSSSLDEGRMTTVAFNFRRGRWEHLPDSPFKPVALPNGLVAVDIPCSAVGDEEMDCQVRVSTRHWDDRHWQGRRVTSHAVRISIDIGDVEWGAQQLGVRDGWAFFRVDRGSEDGRILKVNVDGDVHTLPTPPPDPSGTVFHNDVMCVAPDGIDSVVKQMTATRESSYGPIRHFDDPVPRPSWQVLPATDPVPIAVPGEFVCGPKGLVFMAPPKTSAWVDDHFVTIASSGTPAPPPHNGLELTTAALADGGFAFMHPGAVWRLRDGHWNDWPVPVQPDSDMLISLTTVGDLVVYHVQLPGTERVEFRVIS